MNKKETKYGNVTVIKNANDEWSVVDNNGKVIVPFGKYAWIDGFEFGLARVRTKGMTWWVKEQLEGSLENGMLVLDKNKVKRDTEKDMREHPEWNAKWGIINEKGEEVLPVIYDSVWKFYGKPNRFSTRAEKDGEVIDVFFHELNPSIPVRYTQYNRHSPRHDEEYEYESEYAGSYAHDVMGYSDETIDDVFDGDPEAYWNID